MKKINIENKNSNEKIEIPVNVNVIDEDILDNSEPLFNSEETKPNNKYFFWVAFIFILLLAIIFFMASNSPTIEDLRIKQKEKAEAVLKKSTLLKTWYSEKVEYYSGMINKSNTCINQNSMTGTVVDCNL